MAGPASSFNIGKKLRDAATQQSKSSGLSTDAAVADGMPMSGLIYHNQPMNVTYLSDPVTGAARIIAGFTIGDGEIGG